MLKLINSTTPLIERKFLDMDRKGKPRSLVVVKNTGEVNIKASHDDTTYITFDTPDTGGYNVDWSRLYIEVECVGDAVVIVGG